MLRDKRLDELRIFLRKQQYPETIIEHGINRAIQKGPIVTDLRTTEEKHNSLDKIIPFVSTYNPRDYDIFSFMKQIELNLHNSERMDRILQKKKIVNSKRQPKNLKRILTSSKFDFCEASPSVKKCSDKRCLTCPNLIEGSTIVFSNGKQFTVKQTMSCKSKNVVYSIICELY